jgi:hypothetical protein
MYNFLTKTSSKLQIEVLEDSEILQSNQLALEFLYLKVYKLERFFRIVIPNAFIASPNRLLPFMSKAADEHIRTLFANIPTLNQEFSNIR